jgi:hypothetical protein
MPKSVAPDVVTLPSGDSFVANAVPDPFDARDLEYRPRLQLLPPMLDQRHADKAYYIYRQTGNSCTGHAVASVVNTVLAQALLDRTEVEDEPPKLPRVSPYMLYRLARRYDEWAGEEDAGSSLRGALKGWFHHGIAPEEDWNPASEPDLDDPAFVEICRERPLGAYYRVNPFRLDDMQSAISELQAIAVSGRIHDGWLAPVEMNNPRDGRTLLVIQRRIDSQSRGGHAFALVGYNDVGFLIQNSWGTDWGKGGFATLPYEDWLDSGYDAWVVRPGVPRTPFASGRKNTPTGTGGRLVTAPGPDLNRLTRHVVNLGNNGRMSTQGQFVSTPAQIERIFEHMGRWHDWWQGQGATERHVVLYAHGGLVDAASGLAIAQKHLNWWLNNRTYPISFAWQSGPAEALLDHLVDTVSGRQPAGGIGLDLVENFDRLVEGIARSRLAWIWDEMKQNAQAASDPLDGAIEWPLAAGAAAAAADQPGAALTVSRLAHYVRERGGDVKVHLVGHSAGSIFLSPMLDRLAEAGIPVTSLGLLAPALRADRFANGMLRHIGDTVGRFTTFALTDERELDDVCGANGINVYHKSVLYLVSRAMERPGPGDHGEVALLGMEKFFDRPLGPGLGTMREEIERRGGVCAFTRPGAEPDRRADSQSHGGFDDDREAMTSVLMRALGLTDPALVEGYEANMPLRGTVPDLAPGAPVTPAPVTADGRRLMQPAAANLPGETPLVETAPPQTERPRAPATAEGVVEVAAAPRSGSPVLDVLQQEGWRIAGEDGRRRSVAAPAKPSGSTKRAAPAKPAAAARQSGPKRPAAAKRAAPAKRPAPGPATAPAPERATAPPPERAAAPPPGSPGRALSRGRRARPE